MKKVLFIMAIAFCAVNVIAQTDKTKLSITYNAYYLQYEEDDSLSWDIERLDIGDYSSDYYSLGGDWYVHHSEGKAPYPGTKIRDDEVLKNMPDKGIITFIHMPYWITTQDSIQKLFDWQLMEGDTLVCEYPCKKAQTKFRGRTWTVWYTLDLPYSEGPWKLCGLPGLILHAHDNEGKFIYNCVGIEKGDGHQFSYPPSKRKRFFTPERAEELLMFEAQDNDAYVYMLSGARITARIDAKGRHYKWKPKTAVPYELFPQNHKQKKIKYNPRKKKK